MRSKWLNIQVVPFINFTTLAYVKLVASGDESKIKEKFTNPIYWVISGEHGTGKPTTVHKVCNEIGKGIIYVDVPEDVSEFGKAFAQAIGVYYHQQYIGPLSYTHKIILGPEQGIE
jgi:hypothetical protein